MTGDRGSRQGDRKHAKSCSLRLDLECEREISNASCLQVAGASCLKHEVDGACEQCAGAGKQQEGGEVSHDVLCEA
jgi:hypothetical protein